MENKPIMHRMGKIQLKYKTFFCSSRAYFVILRGDRKKKKKTKAQLPVGFEPKPLRISRSKLNHRATANVRVIESNCRSSRTLTSVTEINPSIFFLVFEAEVGSKLEKEKKTGRYRRSIETHSFKVKRDTKTVFPRCQENRPQMKEKNRNHRNTSTKKEFCLSLTRTQTLSLSHTLSGEQRRPLSVLMTRWQFNSQLISVKSIAAS